MQILESLEKVYLDNRGLRAKRKEDCSHLRSLERLRNCNTSESGVQTVVINLVGVTRTLCKEKPNLQNYLTLPSCTAKQWWHMAEDSCVQNCIECLLCAKRWSKNCGYGIEQNTKISALIELIF